MPEMSDSGKVPVPHAHSEATGQEHRPKKAEIQMSDSHPQHAPPHVLFYLKKTPHMMVLSF